MITLRVATFNIRNGLGLDGLNIWPLRRHATASAIAALGADVIGLQEVYGFQRRWLARQLPGYRVEWSGRRDGRRGEACPVFLREKRATLIESSTRWFADEPTRPGARLPGASFPRLATICRVSVAGREVEVVNTHLDESVSENRVRSVEMLLEWLDASAPRIVMGDLNADPDDVTLMRLRASGLRPTLPPDAPGTNHDFTGRTDGRRIDHILVSEHFEVVTADVRTDRPGGRLPSDHWPVVAELKIGGAR